VARIFKEGGRNIFIKGRFAPRVCTLFVLASAIIALMRASFIRGIYREWAYVPHC
jgi:hypothetical protein